jgi:hypothetical protein
MLDCTSSTYQARGSYEMLVPITKPHSNTPQKPVISAPSTITMSTLKHSSFLYYLYQYTFCNVACQQIPMIHQLSLHSEVPLSKSELFIFYLAGGLACCKTFNLKGQDF